MARPTCDPFAAPERLSVAEAFARHAGIDLLATLAPDGSPDAAALAAQMAAAGLRGGARRHLVRHAVEGAGRPGRAATRPWPRRPILDRYPAAEAALARRAPDDPRVAERFELYACGVELANGFGELTDPAEQRRRFEAEMDEKARVYGETLSAGRGLPVGAGA